MADSCEVGHGWEAFSLVCTFCDVEATAVLDGELDRLRRDSNQLAALRSMGVDNWEGYGPAMAVTGGGGDG